MNKVKWISTKDRLPEEGTPVLIVRKLCNLKLMCVAYLDDDRWYDNYSGDLLDDFYNRLAFNIDVINYRKTNLCKMYMDGDKYEEK